MDNGNLTTTSDIVWRLASLIMIAVLVLAPRIFMVLLLPWIVWGLCKEAGEYDPADYRE